MERFGKWTALALSVSMSGCGGSSTGGDSQSADTGASGSPAAPGASGSSSSGSTGDDDGGASGGVGGGGADGGPELWPLEPEQLDAEISRIEGTSFVVRGGPRGEGLPAASFCDRWSYLPDVGGFMDATVRFERAADGGLEAVASTPLPWLRVERTSLIRDASGWRAQTPLPLAGCVLLAFEEEVEPFWSTPDELVFAFSFEGKTDSPQLVVNARFTSIEELEEVSLRIVAVADHEPPRLQQAPHLDKTDGHYVPVPQDTPYDSPLSFQFTEPLKPGWSVALEDDEGNRFMIAQDDDANSNQPIVVERYFPGNLRWVVSGEDWAGNALESSENYADGSLQAIDGDIEGAASVLSRCWTDDYEEAVESVSESCPARACIDAELEGVPAIAGATSLGLSSSCHGYLRVARKPGATMLRFSARLLREDVADPGLSIALSSLDTGRRLERLASTIEKWKSDLDVGPDVSQLKEISLPLPEGEGDILMEVYPGGALWLDLLRTE